MRIFYHDVGMRGSSRDFPRTVYERVPISRAATALGQEHPLVAVLQREFPSGEFNCWGVPSGARNVIRNLSEGDGVLLVANRIGDGLVPALCPVKIYWTEELPALSRTLWGEERFPFTFFFDTEQMKLTWRGFLNDLDYSSTFDPRGNFNSIAEAKLARFGGPKGYIDFLRREYGGGSGDMRYTRKGSGLKKVLGEQKADYFASVESELRAIQLASLLTPPSLTDGAVPVTLTTSALPRSAAFRVAISEAYGHRCAVCGNGVQSPKGLAAVECAHVYPKRLSGSDDIRNGICLCRMHHWAFDAGWMSLSDELVVLVRADLPEESDYDFIRSFGGSLISLPARSDYRPHPLYLKAHRQLHGFESPPA